MRSCCISLLLAALALGCGTSRATKIQQVEQTVRDEQAPEKLLARGKMFASLGDHTRAEQYFTSALEGGARTEDVLPHLMRSYVVSARFRSAVDVGERYLAKSPGDVSLRFLVATMHSAIGQHDRARAHLVRVVRDSPNHSDAHYALAVLMRDVEQDWVQADYHFREYLKLNPAGSHAAEARDSLLKNVP